MKLLENVSQVWWHVPVTPALGGGGRTLRLDPMRLSLREGAGREDEMN